MEWFLENSHRVSVALLPDSELGAKMSAEEQQRLQVGATCLQCDRHL